MTLELVYPHTQQKCRVVGTAERPEWVAKDVCDVLDLGNVTESLKRVPPHQATPRNQPMDLFRSAING